MTHAEALPGPNGGRPESFHERGLAAPFTTPGLSAARLRAVAPAGPAGGRGRSMLEVLLPNPTGRRGAYVLPWPDIREVATPTVHDVRLGARLDWHVGAGRGLSPAAIRAAAREVAIAGYAGRAAAAAAAEAQRHRDRAEAALRAFLATAIPPGMEMEIKAAAGRAQAIGDLAALFADLGLGLGPGAGDVRLRVLIADMAALARIGAPRPADRPARVAEAQAAIALAAELSFALAARALATARASGEGGAALFRAWDADRPGVIAIATRPDLLLDGWAQVCALGRSHGASQQGDAAMPDATILEMATLLPVLPTEAEAWFDLPQGSLARGMARHGAFAVSGADEQPACALIARNERLRALAA